LNLGSRFRANLCGEIDRLLNVRAKKSHSTFRAAASSFVRPGIRKSRAADRVPSDGTDRRGSSFGFTPGMGSSFSDRNPVVTVLSSQF